MPRSAAQWQEVVARYRQSGLGRQAFCVAEGLPVTTLAKWGNGRECATKFMMGMYKWVQMSSREDGCRV
jgi:hypothetical protein